MTVRSHLALCLLLASPGALATTTIDLATYADAFRLQSAQVEDGLGAEIVACDVNGDGLRDLVVSATSANGIDFSRPSSGEVWIVYGARRRWSGITSIQAAASVRIIGQQEFHSFGSGVACADLNRDGFADVAGGTSLADSLNNTRDQAGQVHVVFGAPTLPALIDLAQPTGTTIYGAEPFDGLGDEFVIGDVDGDGSPDLVLDASHATYLPTNKTQAGKVHVLFARDVWPASIDLRSATDVTIYGATKSDNLGATLTVGDLDRDGTDDLIVDVPGSDRPGTTRTDSGSVYVWRGRATWPATIDLATSNPDLLVYGSDAGDGFGRAALAVSDWDVDGTADLLIGGPLADGPTNSTPDVGEMRSVEPGSVWPPVIDLRTGYSRVLYGLDVRDKWCNRFQVGDVNGDRIPDLTCSGSDADGPSEARDRAGECATIFGRPGLPFDLRLANGDHDVMIYGAQLQDSIASSRFTTDVNDDGIEEIAIRGNYSVPGRLSDVWLVSPVDVDGDGFSQLSDNCPLVSNPDQFDSDGDQRGDACALDWDADMVADAYDCAPSRRDTGRPPDIGQLTVTHDASLGMTDIRWALVPSAERYDVSRGFVASLASGGYGGCQSPRDPDPTDGLFRDEETPPAGQAFEYLVRGIDFGCGGTGTWGQDSSGRERLNNDPSGCR